VLSAAGFGERINKLQRIDCFIRGRRMAMEMGLVFEKL
jgi:hypothetical protein